MNDYTQVIAVLERARSETIIEMKRCGEAGGVGRVASYAPTLINLHKALEIITELSGEKEAFVERMAKARAAKKTAA
jgi:molybdenum-dependent DNA-binding transcriptional regulator ModE